MIEKLIFGVMLAAPIGPVSIEMIKRGIVGGFWPSFKVRIGALLGNALCLLISYFFLTNIMHYKTLFEIISILGSLFLIYMGIKTILSYKKSISVAASDLQQYKWIESLSSGFILAVANPVAIVFWVNIFTVSMVGKTSFELYDLLENSAILLGVTIWGAFLSLILEGGKRVVNSWIIKLVTVLSGILLILFGSKYLYKAIVSIGFII